MSVRRILKRPSIFPSFVGLPTTYHENIPLKNKSVIPVIKKPPRMKKTSPKLSEIPKGWVKTEPEKKGRFSVSELYFPQQQSENSTGEKRVGRFMVKTLDSEEKKSPKDTQRTIKPKMPSPKDVKKYGRFTVQDISIKPKTHSPKDVKKRGRFTIL
jgi:hypothetical protein